MTAINSLANKHRSAKVAHRHVRMLESESILFQGGFFSPADGTFAHMQCRGDPLFASASCFQKSNATH